MSNFELKKITEVEQNPHSKSEQNLEKKDKIETLASRDIFENLKNESDELLNDILELSKEPIDQISQENIESLIEKQRSIEEGLENSRDDSEVYEKLNKSLNNSLDILERLKEQLRSYKELTLDLGLDSEILTKDGENDEELNKKPEEKVYHFFREDFLKEEGNDNEEALFKTFKEFKESHADVVIEKTNYSKLLKKIKNGHEGILNFKPRKKVSFDEIEQKNPYDFVPEELKDNPNLVVFNKELFEMPNSDFMNKFNVSRRIKFKLKNFYKENGYAWFLSQENSDKKVKGRKYTCYSYKDINEKKELYDKQYSNWYREKYADKMDRVREILKSGRKDNPIRYSAPLDDMIEIKLEDFFVDGVTPKDIKNKYPTLAMSNLSEKADKMIHNGYINIYTHKDGKNKKSVQTRKINFLEIEGKKMFPEWYTKKMLEEDIRLGKFFILREYPALRGILDRYDSDFRSSAQMRLFELAGEDGFKNKSWRIQVVKSRGMPFLQKMEKESEEVSISAENYKNDNFPLMDTMSAEKTGFEFEKNLIDEDTIEEVLYRIKAKNYDKYSKYEDDIEFVAEYLVQDYSTDAEDEEDRKRWEREEKEDKNRFDEILKRNNVNLEDLV